MSYVRLKAKIIIDNTGIQINIPIIMVEQNNQIIALGALVDYLIANYQVKSRSWMTKLCQAVGMLLDYTEINYLNFDNPRDLFETFSQRVYAGTIGEDGIDPSGLYWMPKRTKTAKQLLNTLSEFSDWLHKKSGVASLNPWREATSFEQQLNWAAFINKTQRSFLGHLDGLSDATEASKQARNTRQRRIPHGEHGEIKTFPDDLFMDLLFTGFTTPGKDNDPDIVNRYDWRGICITILMHWGGLRISEPFHLWVNDVMPDPLNVDIAAVRVYHPIDGAAPKDFKGPNLRFFPNREAYLKTRYPGYSPRNKELGNLHAGWKNPKMDDISQNYVHVYWLPTEIAGRLFLQAWKLYMYQRMRAKIIADKHPFLFVSFRGGQHGEPYTIDAFRDAHARAVIRIGQVPAKMNGTTPHGHRHAYGQRARRSKVGDFFIQKILHHRSIESQAVYTAPSISEITIALEKATEAIAISQPLPIICELDAFILAERKGQKKYLIRKGDNSESKY